MRSLDAFFRRTELDAATFPEWRDHIAAYEPEGTPPRAYPGYPRWPLPRLRPRFWPPLDRALQSRRSRQHLGTKLPGRRQVARLLQFSHGLTKDGRGPVPSAGSLQALELYAVNFAADWLPCGVYHYDRAAHSLAQLSTAGERSLWQRLVPSLRLLEGGALLWILIGDGERVIRKYAERGQRFLLLEAGHLMQNLCLLSAGLGLCTVPLGGFLERPIARQLALPDNDLVLYVGVCGAT